MSGSYMGHPRCLAFVKTPNSSISSGRWWNPSILRRSCPPPWSPGESKVDGAQGLPDESLDGQVGSADSTAGRGVDACVVFIGAQVSPDRGHFERLIRLTGCRSRPIWLLQISHTRGEIGRDGVGERRHGCDTGFAHTCVVQSGELRTACSGTVFALIG